MSTCWHHTMHANIFDSNRSRNILELATLHVKTPNPHLHAFLTHPPPYILSSTPPPPPHMLFSTDLPPPPAFFDTPLPLAPAFFIALPPYAFFDPYICFLRPLIYAFFDPPPLPPCFLRPPPMLTRTPLPLPYAFFDPPPCAFFNPSPHAFFDTPLPTFGFFHLFFTSSTQIDLELYLCKLATLHSKPPPAPTLHVLFDPPPPLHTHTPFRFLFLFLCSSLFSTSPPFFLFFSTSPQPAPPPPRPPPPPPSSSPLPLSEPKWFQRLGWMEMAIGWWPYYGGVPVVSLRHGLGGVPAQFWKPQLEFIGLRGAASFPNNSPSPRAGQPAQTIDLLKWITFVRARPARSKEFRAALVLALVWGVLLVGAGWGVVGV